MVGLSITSVYAETSRCRMAIKVIILFFFKTNIQHLFDAVILSLRVTRIIEFLCFALFLQKMLHLFAERKLKRLFRICIQDSRYFSLKQLM